METGARIELAQKVRLQLTAFPFGPTHKSYFFFDSRIIGLGCLNI